MLLNGFLFNPGMSAKRNNAIPVVIAVTALAVICLIHTVGHLFSHDRDQSESSLNFVERLEGITYDARVRLAALFPGQAATNLAFLFFDDRAFEKVNNGPGHFMWPWPRFIHGKIVRELSAQGAHAIGFDVLFPDLYRDTPETEVLLSDKLVSSDDFFAAQIHQASNVVLAATDGDILPAPLFATNAWALGDISSQADYGVLRRVKAFNDQRVWHPLIQDLKNALDLDLNKPDLSHRDQIIFPIIRGGGTHSVPLNSDGSLNLAELGQEPGPIPQKPYMMKRIWNFGIVLAARELNLDLEHPRIESDQITLRGPKGVERVIPIDAAENLYIDWSLTWEGIQARKTAVYPGTVFEVFLQDAGRTNVPAQPLNNPFQNRIVVVGTVATGNNVSDIGATPLEEKTMLVTKHINIANSLLMGTFIRRAGFPVELLLIIALGAVSALLTWRINVIHSVFAVSGAALVYLALAAFAYVQFRYWIPIIVPLGGGLIVPHFALVTYRLIFEQKEQRRVKQVFSKIVSPEVVQELLDAEKLSLGGAMREITIYFADVRGFTEFTDISQAQSEEYIRKNNLTGPAAEAYFDRQAAETLATVNVYLGTIADIVKKHQGTLDKYIGDCVMAFWGAPSPNPKHALACVRAAIDAQRSLYALNQSRYAENERRKGENAARQLQNEPPLPMHPLLQMGTGINSGKATVGLMGSDAHILNYTVFGREVNVASRLETVSQRGRIIVSEATFREVKRDDPDLAATFVDLPPITVKGIRQAIKIFEVPWKVAVEKPVKSGPTELSPSPAN